MKKYMVVMITEEGTDAYFTDDYSKAAQTKRDCECGMGGRAQVYKWFPRSEEYKLMYK